MQASYILTSAVTGEPLALIDGLELTLRRTAAASALASKFLSRSDARRLLVVGTGNLAPHLAAAHAAVRPGIEVEFWGRRPEKAAEASRSPLLRGLRTGTAADLEAAVRAADIVSTATLATEPLIFGDWLRAGIHVDLVGGFTPGMREADDEAMRRSTVFVDTRDGALVEAGDLTQPIESGALAPDDVAADLYELCRGEHGGRGTADEITLFKSVGAALGRFCSPPSCCGSGVDGGYTLVPMRQLRTRAFRTGIPAAGVLLLAALAVTSCAAPAAAPGDPPRAEARPHELETHGDVRVDEYYWLRERENPEVIAYLEAENAYVDAALAHTEPLRESVFAEIRSRVVEDDSSVPYRDGDYWYYTRYEEGKQYPIHGRRPIDGDVFGGDQAPEAEEVLIDVNEIAEGKEYTAVRPSVSPDHRILAYGVDDVGRRFYTVRFKDLSTGEILADEIPDVTANLVWAADSATLFYVRQDPDTLRAYQVYRHRLGSTAPDELVYEEPDETFSVFLGRTQSRKYLLATSSHTLRTEVRILRADDPDGDFAVFEPRGERHEYSVDHLGDRFWVRTNDRAPNFRLMSTAEGDTGRAAWREELPHRDDVLLAGFELFDRLLVLAERRDGLEQLRIEPRAGGGAGDGSVTGHDLDFGEPTYSAGLGVNPDPSSGTLRYVYQSLTTPRSVFDYDPATREKTLRKQDQVLGGFDSANYRSERLWATAGDGTQVPVSLVYRPDLRPEEGGSPLLLYGYGSYGASMDASFSSPLLSLIDRGFVYAIAHIRGGEEMGRSLVRERQAAPQEEHVHGLHRRGRASRGRGLRGPGPDLRDGRQRRRSAGRRGVHDASRPMGRRRGAGALR